MDEKKQFFELTNEQRRFFALPIVSEVSVRLALDPSPYDRYDTVGYAEGNHLYKLVQSGENYNGHYFYNEYQVDAVLSDDYRLILPKKAGKPKRLTASSAEKLTGIGMRLLHNGDFVYWTIFRRSRHITVRPTRMAPALLWKAFSVS